MEMIYSLFKSGITRGFMLMILSVFFAGGSLMAQDKIDIGIFRVASDEVEVRIRPEFDISTVQAFSEIRYTLRWPATSSLEITELVQVAPYNIDYLPGTEVLDGGYRYQTFIFLSSFVDPFTDNITAGEEVVISRIRHTGGANFVFEIVEEADLVIPNTEYYFEFNCLVDDGIGPCGLGIEDATGVIYTVATFPVASWALFMTIILIGGAIFFIRRY